MTEKIDPKQVTMEDLSGMVDEINRIAEPLRQAGYGAKSNNEDDKALGAMIEREMEHHREEPNHDARREETL